MADNKPINWYEIYEAERKKRIAEWEKTQAEAEEKKRERRQTQLRADAKKAAENIEREYQRQLGQQVQEQQTAEGGVSVSDSQLQNQNKRTGGAVSNSKDPLLRPVYLGKISYAPGAYHVGGTPALSVRDDVRTVGEASQDYYSWDEKQRNKLRSQLTLAGYNTDGFKDRDFAQAWAQYVAEASNYYGQGVSMTPWDLISRDIQQREAAAPRTVTQTSTAYDLSTRGDAQALFTQAAQQLLGRDPTKSEVGAFHKMLNKQERANPRTTTTTSNYTGGEMTSQSSTTSGGMGEGARTMLAMDDLKADPEYGAYQAATTYFDAMMAMIGGD